jgi:hypothetical protein
MYSPFKVNENGILIIPNKYLDVLWTLNLEIDFESLEGTDENMVRELLVTGYWMNCWYTDELPTPKSEFLSLEEAVNEHEWDIDKFVRLNSLSSKNQHYPITKLNIEVLHNMLETDRCQKSLSMAQRTGQEISVVVRDWVDLSMGIEFRCFIFEDKLKAICLNDHAIIEMSNEIIVLRAQTLLDKIKYNLPCVDCIMDIWLHDDQPEKDLVIEFNSYGFWGNSGSGLFDWFEDAAQLYNSEDTMVEVRI